MNARRFDLKTILLIIAFTILLFCIVLNFSTVWKTIWHIFSYFAPLTTGLALAYVMNVLLRLLEEKVFAFMKRSKRKFVRGMLRPLCLTLTVLIVLSLITILIAVVLPDLRDSVVTLVNKLPGYFESLKEWALGVLTYIGADTEWLESFTIDWKLISNTVMSFFQSRDGSAILGTTASFASVLTGSVMNFIFSVIIAIYFLAQKERICAFVRRMVIAFLPEKITRSLFHVVGLSHEIFSNFIRGQCTEAVILGLLAYVGMLIFRFEYAGIISIMIGCTAVIPIVGALVGEIFGAFLLLTISPLRALLFLVFILTLQQLEGTLIYPRVVGTSVGLPGIIVFAAVLIGGNMFGIMGALLAVPVCAVLYSLLREAVDKRRPPVEPAPKEEMPEQNS